MSRSVCSRLSRLVRTCHARPDLEGMIVPPDVWAAAKQLAQLSEQLLDAVDIARESRDAAESAAKAAVQAEMAALRAENARSRNQIAYREIGIDMTEGR